MSETGTCGSCGREGLEVKEQWAQATRHEPRTFLGRHVWCPECQVSSPYKVGNLSTPGTIGRSPSDGGWSR